MTTDAVMVQAEAGATEQAVKEAAEAKDAKSTNDERPGWLPKKFNTAEDLAKAYAELEKKQGETGQTDAETPAENSDGKPATSFTESQNQASEALQAQGLDFNKYQQEFAQNGGLLDESYAELDAKGFSKPFVDSWVDGQVALGESMRSRVLEGVGGEDGFAKMSEWATANVPPAELEAINQVLEGGDEPAMKAALSGLHARFQANTAQEPDLLHGEPAAGVQPFKSTAELTKVMASKEYKTDPAKRAEVARRLAVTKF